jgi:hypothetical protein
LVSLRDRPYAFLTMHGTDDLHARIDELLDIDWKLRFEPFTSRDERRLEGFNTFGWRLGNRSFFRSAARLHVGTETRLDHAGTEALENAATTLRQTWQAKDLANHAKVVDVLRARAAGDDREHTLSVLDELDRRFVDALAEPRMTFVAAEDLRAGRRPRVVAHVTAEQVLDDWLNGIVVHTVPAKAKAVDVWSSAQYEWEVAKAAIKLSHVVLATHVVVRGALGVLHEDRRVASGPGITATTAGSG